ncbi:lysozyme [Xanthomonas translucens]|uniref:lysozyme n=1 Tax=Xanthomonas campestris pv. translucens TaxID=343 RepID=UPI00071E8CBF|nr:lysozyme [Xanthomonas translucens]
MENQKSDIRARVLRWASGILLSAAGISAIVSHEGLKYKAYPDPGTGGAPWTICYGHTGPDVFPGLEVNQAWCDRALARDLLVAQTAVTRAVRVPITQGEMDAYASFVFNVGEGNWRASTMLRLLNQGKRKEACDQFPRWIYANKLKLGGLVSRRYEERATCLSGGAYVHRP